MDFDGIINKVIEFDCVLTNFIKRDALLYEKSFLKINGVPSILDTKKNYHTFEIVESYDYSHVILLQRPQENSTKIHIKLKYSFFNHSEIIVLLLDHMKHPQTSFETVGNIVHLNLKDDVLSYRYIIGKVIFDKTNHIVINKIGRIHNTFRSYDFEVIGANFIDYNDFIKFKDYKPLNDCIVEKYSGNVHYKLTIVNKNLLDHKKSSYDSKTPKYKEIDLPIKLEDSSLINFELSDQTFGNTIEHNIKVVDETELDESLNIKTETSNKKLKYARDKRISILLDQSDIDCHELKQIMKNFTDADEKFKITIDSLSTIHKERDIKFFIDIKNVYWCSKLQEERRKLLKNFKNSQVLCDVFCGVGPVSIPALKKGCVVFANDLNPDAVSCLKKNIELNRLNKENIHVYNLSAQEFLSKIKHQKIDHFFLNLPEHSLDHLNEVNSFPGIKTVHCYFFCLSGIDVPEFVYKRTGFRVKKSNISYIRNVSPSKDMYKLEYIL